MRLPSHEPTDKPQTHNYMMTAFIKKVVVIGASGNFGTPITASLISAGFDVTVISRIQSTATFPSGIPVIKIEYTLDELTKALAGQDAVVCVVGPAGIVHQVTLVDAAEAAGVKRFIIDDFGWGPNVRGLPEFKDVHAQRRLGWNHANARAEANPAFTYTGITSGNPIDWALRRFPLMGFNVARRQAIIYDAGTEKFTGTTLNGISQAVVGVLQHPDETANRFVKVWSLATCQNELLEAFQSHTGSEWEVERSSTKVLMESGRSKFHAGVSGWVLELVVAQLFDQGEARCVVAPRREDSDCDLLGVLDETPQDIVAKAMEGES